MGKHMFYVTHTSLLSILLLKFSSFYAFILLVLSSLISLRQYHTV